MSKIKIVVEVKDGSVVSIGEIGQTEEVDKVAVIVVDHDMKDDQFAVFDCVPDWQAPTASELFQENPNIYKRLKQIENKYN